jgi:prepilin-type N-terminal cleavage/methylation domain-containing protein
MEVGMLKRKNQSGFTLLEVAMVLIVASLIVLALIKAEGIWDEAKLFRLIRQVQEIQVASALFQNKMGVLPGEGATAGQIDNSVTDWKDDLADHNYVVSAVKTGIHPFGGIVELEYTVGNTASPWATGENFNILKFRNVPTDVALAVITALDDGDGQDGKMRALDPSDNSDTTDVNLGTTTLTVVHVFAIL